MINNRRSSSGKGGIIAPGLLAPYTCSFPLTVALNLQVNTEVRAAMEKQKTNRNHFFEPFIFCDWINIIVTRWYRPEAEKQETVYYNYFFLHYFLLALRPCSSFVLGRFKKERKKKKDWVLQISAAAGDRAIPRSFVGVISKVCQLLWLLKRANGPPPFSPSSTL